MPVFGASLMQGGSLRVDQATEATDLARILRIEAGDHVARTRAGLLVGPQASSETLERNAMQLKETAAEAEVGGVSIERASRGTQSS